MWMVLFFFNLVSAQNLSAANLNQTDKLNFFNSRLSADCKITDSKKIEIINSQLKCLVINQGKVDFRFSCKPEEVLKNLQEKIKKHCAETVEDHSNNSPIQKNKKK